MININKLILKKIEDKLIYINHYKSFYLIMIIGLAATVYLVLARLLGIFKIKNYKTD